MREAIYDIGGSTCFPAQWAQSRRATPDEIVFKLSLSPSDGLATAMTSQQHFLEAMTPQELREVILEPARRNGWRVQEGLAEQMIEGEIHPALEPPAGQ